MEGCPTCEYWEQENPTIIAENGLARAQVAESFREGHCIVFVKRHIQSISAIEPDEYAAIFDLITSVSKALEKKYSTRKTYLIVVGDADKFQHLHFHLIPKHRALPSMGTYCFQALWEAEGHPDFPDSQKQALAQEITEIMSN